MSIQDAGNLLSSRERLDRTNSESENLDSLIIPEHKNGHTGSGPGYHPVPTKPSSQKGEHRDLSSGVYERGLCGIGACQPRWSQRLANLNVFVVTYGIAGIWMMTQSALLGSQITSIERHLGISSSKTGLLLSSNEIGYLIFVILGSHLGKYSHIPRCLSMSGIIFGLATAAMSFARFVEPHVWRDMSAPGQLVNFSGNQDPSAKYLCELDFSKQQLSMNNSTNESSVSSPELSSDDNEPISGLSWGFWLIFFSSMIGGAVKSYRLPLMTYYVETNIEDKSRTGLLIGIAFTAMVLGPPIALFLGGYISSLPVDLKETTLLEYDQRWIGAWWLGLVIVGIACIACSLPIMFFPSYILREKKGQVTKVMENAQESLHAMLLELPKSLGRIFRRPIFILCLVFSCLEGLAFSGWFAFAQKYTEVQFNKTAQEVSTVTGAVALFALALGTFAGGFFTSKFKLSLRGCAIIALAMAGITALSDCLNLLFGCNNSNVIGKATDRTASMSACDCSDDIFIVCGEDGVNYLSPCLAGCTNVTNMVFSNCSGINNGLARPGLCDLDCGFFIPFMFVYFVGFFLGCSSIVPGFMLVIRSVELRDQSLASGAVSFCQTMIGLLPSPILYGRLIDSACSLWNPGGGNCMLYDREKFRYVYQGLSLSLRFVSVLVMTAVLWLVIRERRNERSGNDKEKEAIK